MLRLGTAGTRRPQASVPYPLHTDSGLYHHIYNIWPHTGWLVYQGEAYLIPISYQLTAPSTGQLSIKSIIRGREVATDLLHLHHTTNQSNLCTPHTKSQQEESVQLTPHWCTVSTFQAVRCHATHLFPLLMLLLLVCPHYAACKRNVDLHNAPDFTHQNLPWQLTLHWSKQASKNMV